MPRIRRYAPWLLAAIALAVALAPHVPRDIFTPTRVALALATVLVALLLVALLVLLRRRRARPQPPPDPHALTARHARRALERSLAAARLALGGDPARTWLLLGPARHGKSTLAATLLDDLQDVTAPASPLRLLVSRATRTLVLEHPPTACDPRPFLKLRRPLDAILLVVSLPDLAALDLQPLRTRLRDLHDALEISVPIHLVCTHLDRLAGHHELVGDDASPWGLALASPEHLPAALRTWSRWVDTQRLARLAGEPSPARRARLYTFAADFAAACERLADLTTLFTQPDTPPLALRTVFFIAARRDAAPGDRVLHQLAAQLHLPPPARSSTRPCSPRPPPPARPPHRPPRPRPRGRPHPRAPASPRSSHPRRRGRARPGRRGPRHHRPRGRDPRAHLSARSRRPHRPARRPHPGSDDDPRPPHRPPRPPRPPRRARLRRPRRADLHLPPRRPPPPPPRHPPHPRADPRPPRDRPARHRTRPDLRPAKPSAPTSCSPRPPHRTCPKRQVPSTLSKRTGSPPTSRAAPSGRRAPPHDLPGPRHAPRPRLRTRPRARRAGPRPPVRPRRRRRHPPRRPRRRRRRLRAARPARPDPRRQPRGRPHPPVQLHPPRLGPRAAATRRGRRPARPLDPRPPAGAPRAAPRPPARPLRRPLHRRLDRLPRRRPRPPPDRPGQRRPPPRRAHRRRPPAHPPVHRPRPAHPRPRPHPRQHPELAARTRHAPRGDPPRVRPRCSPSPSPTTASPASPATTPASPRSSPPSRPPAPTPPRSPPSAPRSPAPSPTPGPSSATPTSAASVPSSPPSCSPPLEALQAAVTDQDKLALLRTYCHELHAPLRHLAARYPFDPTAADDASLADFTALFHPETGALARLRDGDLAPWLTGHAEDLAAKTPPRSDPHPLSPRVVALLRRAAALASLTFPKGQLGLDLTVDLRCNADISRVTLTIGKSRHSYTCGPDPRATLHWPAPPDDDKNSTAPDGANLELLGRDGRRQQLPGHGPWGLFRLLEKDGVVTPPTDPTHDPLLFRFDLRASRLGTLDVALTPARTAGATFLFGPTDAAPALLAPLRARELLSPPDTLFHGLPGCPDLDP